MDEPKTNLMKLGGVVFLVAGLLWVSGGGVSRFHFFGIDSFILGSLLLFLNSLIFFALGSNHIRKYLARRE